VVDAAVVPEKKSKPRRSVIVLMTFFVALAIAVLLSFLLEALERARERPNQLRRLELLRSYVRAK
jgi:uncharacterized protein involved in exopolysaccharide biosynthesis